MDEQDMNNQPAAGTTPVQAASSPNTEQPKSTMSVKTEVVGEAASTNSSPAPNPGTVTTPPMPETPSVQTASTTPSSMSANTEPAMPNLTTTSPSTTGATFEPPGNGKALKIVGLLVFAVVVIGGMALGGYYLGTNSSPVPSPTPAQTIEPIASSTPEATPDPTADWELYKDEEYGFTFKYPEDWEVRDLLPSNKSLAAHKDDLVYLGIAQVDVEEDIAGSLVIKEDDVVTAELKSIKTIPSGTPSKVKSENKITFAGYSASEVTIENTEAKVTSKYIVFSDGTYTYVISGGGLEDNSVINQIIETFEFSEAMVSTSPSPKDQ